MGCNDTPIINYENSYSACTMTRNNSQDINVDNNVNVNVW